MWKRIPRKTATAQPVETPEYRDPTIFDVRNHYRGAEFWLRVAEEPGRRSVDATAAAAAIAQAHASMGLLAYKIIAGQPVKHRAARMDRP